MDSTTDPDNVVRTAHITAQVPQDLFDEFTEMAEAKGRNRSAELRDAMRDAIARWRYFSRGESA